MSKQSLTKNRNLISLASIYASSQAPIASTAPSSSHFLTALVVSFAGLPTTVDYD